MCGELTDKEVVARINDTLDTYAQDQFEILLYQKNRKYQLHFHGFHFS